MENKINVAEILKLCPPGMELDCTMYEGVKLDNVAVEECDYPIKIVTKSGFETRLTKYGQNVKLDDAKCVIFPKGKTTWEGFEPSCKFKVGDIVTYKYEIGLVSMILNKFDNFTKTCHYHCALYDNAQGFITDNYIVVGEPKYICLATEEKKTKTIPSN